MKTTITRSKGQVYSVGNYLMTGKVLGKGHFARVEEATHRIIGKKVAIKVIDLTCIKEEYARRNLHREPRVMAKLRHPCIAALYETMMHGPRLYVVMEAAGGGDLCTHVLAARGTARGLPESRARGLAAQLVSAVRHMHARGVVHRDLKMENIMLDTSKQFIKIVDFGLSNVWSLGGALRTPCGSLEYAAPELFVDGRRYGPEVDLWSVGVIVYGMVTGGLPFAGEGGEGRSRPQLRAAISRGFTRKQRAALTCVSAECKNFIQHLLEPNVELRMKIEEASRHRWIKKPGLRMKTHPFGTMDPKVNREIYRQISELSTQTVMDVVAQIKADPFGSIAGMYNVKCHLHQLQLLSGADLLWSSNAPEPRPVSPPEYKAHHEIDRLEPPTTKPVATPKVLNGIVPRKPFEVSKMEEAKSQIVNGHKPNPGKVNTATQVSKDAPKIPLIHMKVQSEAKKSQSPSPRCMGNRPISMYGMKQPVYKIYDNGDCGLDPRLPSIDEHSNTNLNDSKKVLKNRTVRAPCVHKISLEDERPLRLNSCPNRLQGDAKKTDFYRRAGDALPSWRASGAVAVHSPATRILLQTNSTTIKRASLGSIVSPHSSSNSHCKSERAMPVGWFPRPAGKEAPVPRLRRTLPLK